MPESASSFEIETASLVWLVGLMKAATIYFPRCVIKPWFLLMLLIELMNDVRMTGLRSPRATDVASPLTGLRHRARTGI